MQALCRKIKTGMPVGIKSNDPACNVERIIKCPACNVDIMASCSLPKTAAMSKDQPCAEITNPVEPETLSKKDGLVRE